MVTFTADVTQTFFNIQSLFYLTNTAATARRIVCRSTVAHARTAYGWREVAARRDGMLAK